MNKLFKTLTFLFFSVILCLNLQAQSGKVIIKLKQPPPNKLGAGDLWNLELDNTTGKDIKIYLTGTATEEKDGLIIEGKSKPFTVKPGKSNYKYNDFSNAEVKYNNGKYKEIILRTGNAPEGSYTICVTAFDEDGNEVGRENCIMQNIQQTGSLSLISPSDGEEIDPDTLPGLAFTWTPSPKGGPYSLKIVELKGDQSPDAAIKESRPILDKEGITSSTLQYSSLGIKFTEGQKYAWQISSGDAQSEVWSFSMMMSANTHIGIDSVIIKCDDDSNKVYDYRLRVSNLSTTEQAQIKNVFLAQSGAGPMISIPIPPGPVPTPPTGMFMTIDQTLPTTLNVGNSIWITGTINAIASTTTNFEFYVWGVNPLNQAKGDDFKDTTLTNCKCDGCKDFVKKVGIKPFTKGGANFMQASIQAGPKRIKKIAMELVYINATSNKECPLCKNKWQMWGNWVNPSMGGGMTIGTLSGPNPVGITRELIWGSNIDAGVDLMSTPANVNLQGYFDMLIKDLSCCNSKVDYCVRFYFTDTTCVTCDTVLCGSMSLKGEKIKPRDDRKLEYQLQEFEKKRIENPDIEPDGEGQGYGETEIKTEGSEVKQQYSFAPVVLGDMAATCEGSFLNPNRYVLGIIKVQNFASAPLDNYWSGVVMHHGPGNNWTIDNLGQIFGVTFDKYGNIFTSATAIYANDVWGSGQTAPVIWKIDASTGNYTAINTSLPNSSSEYTAFGNICYDSDNDQLFVSNFEDGIIYRLSTSGAVLSTFDFGTVDNTAGLVPVGERVWAVQYNKQQKKLYYSVWKTGSSEIRAVVINAGGSFGTDQFVIDIPFFISSIKAPVSDISFTANGLKMIVAEMGMIRNEDLSRTAHASRVLEYAWNGISWVPSGIDFGIGQQSPRNSAGGVSYGYGDENNTLCDKMVWATGDALHYNYSPIERIYGVQGIPSTGTVPFSLPWTSNAVLIDLDSDVLSNDKNLLGDVEIYRKPCDSTGNPQQQKDCCKDFMKNVSYTINQKPNTSQWDMNVTLQAGPSKIKRVSASIVNLRMSYQNDACINCVNSSRNWGNFVPKLPPIAGLSTPTLTSQITGSGAFSREIIWGSMYGPAINMTSPTGPLPLHIMMPNLSNISCCNDTIFYCIRFRFTDENCVTCDTLICNKIIQKGTVSKRADINERSGEQMNSIDDIQFNTDGNSLTTISIYGSDGTLIESKDQVFSEGGAYAINTKNMSLADGIYYLRVKSGKEDVIKKFIVYNNYSETN